jgi:D-sedoheptulose 7-phosphate isomerase
MDEHIRKQIADTIQTHRKMLSEFEQGGMETIAAISQKITQVLEQNGTVYLCGNGGSAADAQHVAGELVGRFRMERRALPAVALSTDSSVVTCIANDYAYDKIFERQVEGLVRKGDILWAFSTSGTSRNVIAAAATAKGKGAYVIAFTGTKNSKLEEIADMCLCAENESTARSQEIHQLAYHIICDFVDRDFVGESS